MKNGRKHLLAAVAFLFLSSCLFSQEKIEFEKGERAVESQNYRAALEHFGNVVKRQVNTPLALDAAKEAGRISYYDLKD